MSTESVEILLAAYNGSKYIREQMDSILNQTDTRWHLTVSDDGSTDGTLSILDAYAAQFPEKISVYRSGIRFGNARDHFFHLMRRCTAPYILFSDQGDIWRPDKVEKTMRAIMEAEAEVGASTPVWAFTDLTPVDEQLRPIVPSLMQMQKQYTDVIDYRAILMQNVVTGCATGINRALARLAGRCTDLSRVILHDWWLAAVAARFGRILYIDEPLGMYRQHGHNSVGAKDVGSAGYVLRMLARIGELRKSILRKKRQAAVFAKTYQAELHAEDRAFLHGFGRARSGPVFYGRYRKQIHGFCRLAGFALLG